MFASCRYCFALAIVCLMPQQVHAQNFSNIRFRVTFEYRFRYGARQVSRFPYRYYRGVLLGTSEELVEGEPDLAVLYEEVLLPIDIAHQLMRGEISRSGVGHYSAKSINGAAVEAFELHFEDNPNDWYSMREYAIALMIDGQYQAGIDAMIRAYSNDSAMVRNPIDADLLGDQRNAYQKLTARMVRFVTVLQKIDSGSVSADLTEVQGGSVSQSWFVVAVLLQAQGLDKHAMVNLEKAIANGLDDEIGLGLGELMRDALVGP